jgi:hypothetical protein
MTHFERSHQTYDVPPTFAEPFSGTLYDRQFGSMPANPFKSDIVRARQACIEKEFLKLFEPPAGLGVPDEFAQFFRDDYEIGERRRQMTNYDNYMAWQASAPVIPDELLLPVDRYESGTAEVEDVFDIILGTSMIDGMEVGRVTHPYWRRMQHLQPLRDSVAKAIVERGGVLERQSSPYRSIDIVPAISIDQHGNQRIHGHLARYKHDIGSMVRPSDGKVIHVVERQIAGIRIDETSGFSQGVLRRMHEVADAKENFVWSNIKDERFEYHLRDTGCRGFIEKAIQTDATDDYIVPESTTVFMFAEDPRTSRAFGDAALTSATRYDSPYYASKHVQLS